MVSKSFSLTVHLAIATCITNYRCMCEKLNKLVKWFRFCDKSLGKVGFYDYAKTENFFYMVIPALVFEFEEMEPYNAGF